MLRLTDTSVTNESPYSLITNPLPYGNKQGKSLTLLFGLEGIYVLPCRYWKFLQTTSMLTLAHSLTELLADSLLCPKMQQSISAQGLGHAVQRP